MRITVPTAGSITIINTGQSRKGFSIQNVGSADIYYSDDQRLLDSVTAADLPTAGHDLPSATPVLPPVVYPIFIGKLFARAQSGGAQLEITIYEVDLPCNTFRP